MMRSFCLFCAFLFCSVAIAQNPLFSGEIEWEDPSKLQFSESDQGSEGQLPFWGLNIAVDQADQFQYALKVTATEEVSLSESMAFSELLPDEFEWETQIYFARKRSYLSLELQPYRKTSDGKLEYIVSFEITKKRRDSDLEIMRDPPIFANESILKDGDIYAVAVTETGIHEMDYNYLKDLGIDLDGIAAHRINVFGNGSGSLPELLCDSRKDDLQPVNIWIQGGDDGKFNSGDKLFFYGRGPHQWSYNQTTERYERTTNVYDTRSYYFIKISATDTEPVYPR